MNFTVNGLVRDERLRYVIKNIKQNYCIIYFYKSFMISGPHLEFLALSTCCQQLLAV